MSAKRVVAPRGIPASGKSTWVRERMASDPRSARINNDDLVVSMFNGEERSKARGVTLHHLRLAMLRVLLADDSVDTVYLDNTNLAVSSLSAQQMVALELGAEFIVDDRFLSVAVEECVARDAQRENPVGEDVVRAMHRKAAALRPWAPRGYPAVEPYANDPALPSVWIFDVDGTLAIKHPDRGIYDLSMVHLDAPNDPVVGVLLALVDNGEGIVVMSGREDSAREATEAWLDSVLDFTPPLHMRRAGDVRPDYVVKAELFAEHIAGKYRVAGVFDDRDQVVNLWRRRLCLPTFQVADGDF